MQNNSKKRYPVKRMNVSINMEKTGAHIKHIIRESGYSIHDIMEITGITSEQAIYKWYRGKSIPSIEVQIILCRLLGLKMTELIIVDDVDDTDDVDDASEGEASSGDKKIHVISHKKAAPVRPFHKESLHGRAV